MESGHNYSFEHCWRYFQLHSQQRMTVFNFYLVICGLTAAGIGFSFQQGENYKYMASLLGIFLTFTSVIFFKLDQRVSLLIKNSESALVSIESTFHVETCKVFTKDSIDNTSSNSIFSVWTYGKCLRYSFFIMGYSGAVIACLPFLMLLITI